MNLYVKILNKIATWIHFNSIKKDCTQALKKNYIL